jgi:hypothetical protein
MQSPKKRESEAAGSLVSAKISRLGPGWFSRFVFAAAVAITPLAGRAQTGAIDFRSAESRVSLVELYTSEGCSSCPPADAWLGRLKDSPRLWSEFVPVAFHVDYWDRLGWRDPWSSPEWSDRQRALAGSWRAGEVYTPCVVLNGSEWRGWGPTKGPPSTAAEKTGALSVHSADGGSWTVTFAPAKAGEGYEARAALLACGLSSNVRAGENAGRRLAHDFTVIALEKASLGEFDGVVRGELFLPPRKTALGERWAVAVWVVKTGRMEPVQAAGGWLPGTAKP